MMNNEKSREEILQDITEITRLNGEQKCFLCGRKLNKRFKPYLSLACSRCNLQYIVIKKGTEMKLKLLLSREEFYQMRL